MSTDVENTLKWSNSFVKFEGGIKDKKQITVHINPMPKSKNIQKVNHKIFLKDGHYFGWNDSRTLGARDNHRFLVEHLDNGKTRFIQSYEMIGGMTWLIGGILMKKR